MPDQSSLVDLLTVSAVDEKHFVPASPVLGPSGHAVGAGLYGGQVAAQALGAAIETVDSDRKAHSLHGYFLRPGRLDQQLVYEVERDRDGRSYSARRVIAKQDERVIFSMAASFHTAEDGPDVQKTAPLDVRPPGESTPVETHLVGVEVRLPAPDTNQAHATMVWVRCTEALGADENRHIAALTYISDLYSGLPDVLDIAPGALMTSIDHAIWIHRPPNLNEWVLMDHRGLSVASGRGWYSSRMSDATGTLLASLTQEMVLRPAR
jgi:acyl-CoA thioesterase II